MSSLVFKTLFLKVAVSRYAYLKFYDRESIGQNTINFRASYFDDKEMLEDYSGNVPSIIYASIFPMMAVSTSAFLFFSIDMGLDANGYTPGESYWRPVFLPVCTFFCFVYLHRDRKMHKERQKSGIGPGLHLVDIRRESSEPARTEDKPRDTEITVEPTVVSTVVSTEPTVVSTVVSYLHPTAESARERFETV